MSQRTLSKRQAEALEFIESFIISNGYSPAIRDIGAHFKYQSSSTAFKIVEALVLKGYITKGEFGARTIRLTKKVAAHKAQDTTPRTDSELEECIKGLTQAIQKALLYVNRNSDKWMPDVAEKILRDALKGVPVNVD
ncbi:LexA repressor [compost metagenome]